MASISTDKQGRRRILFVDPNSDQPAGERKAIRLGKVSKASAEEIKRRVHQLLEAKTLNRPMATELADWVANLLPPLANKLARVGLIPKPEPKRPVTLGEHLTNYFARRSDVKPATLTHLAADAAQLVRAFRGGTAASRDHGRRSSRLGTLSAHRKGPQEFL